MTNGGHCGGDTFFHLRNGSLRVFARIKKSGAYHQRIEGRVRQRVVATLGRLDELKQSG